MIREANPSTTQAAQELPAPLLDDAALEAAGLPTSRGPLTMEWLCVDDGALERAGELSLTRMPSSYRIQGECI